MKKILLAALISASLLCTHARADKTFGVGFGSMYNGVGINIGRTNSNSLTFGALGCVGWSYSSGSDSATDATQITHRTSKSSYETNCGIGVGYVSSALLPGEKQGLGLSVAFTYNTDEDYRSESGFEWSFSPGYYYFFNSVGGSGLNLGLGPRFTLGEGGSTANPLMINLGFQF